MSATIIDGKQIAAELRAGIAADVQRFAARTGITPGLAVVLVGEDPASQVYVRMKERACAEVGMRSEKHTLPAGVSEEELLGLVQQLNEREDIHGILVQLPLPGHLSELAVIEAIDPAKDVDGFHPINAGRLFSGGEGFVPCTPAGVVELIRRTGVEVEGKEAVVVGRSNIVGKPVAMLLTAAHATVTLCHSRTSHLADVCRRADVLVVAAGRPYLIGGDAIKPGSVVIDVGVNRLADGKLAGDVRFDEAKEVAGHITPVPGGVGPMTIAMLLRNTLIAAENQVEA